MTTIPPTGPGFPSPEHEQFDWHGLLFPKGSPVATPAVTFAPHGPFGQARLASRDDLAALFERGERHRDEHLRIANAYAIVHDPNPSVIDAADLPIPLGVDAPNVIFFGRSGSGKTQKGTLPAAIDVIRRSWSLIYLNVKGRSQTRLIRKVAALHGRADQVRLLSPGSLDRTVGCTLLEGCADVLMAREVAACMVAGAARHSRSGEGAWAYNQAEDFLTHAISAVCADLPPERRTLAEIRRVVAAGEYEAFVAAHPNHPVLRKFANFQSWNRNGETVASTIGEATSFIDGLEPLLSTDEFSLAAFADRPGILIVEIDEPDLEKFTPFITLTLGRLVRQLQRAACRSSTGALAHKTVVVIDELAPMSFIPGLASTLHTCRERRYCFVAATQSVAQLHSLHGPATADVLLSGFQSQIALGGKLDPTTAEHLSRRCGTCTISVPTIVETKGTDSTPSISARSWSMAPRQLLLPGDIASPLPHPMLGDPLTFLLGDATPPFQAYVVPAHEEGWIARLMDEGRAMTADDDLRLTPLHTPTRAESVSPPPTSPFTALPLARSAADRATAILHSLAAVNRNDPHWAWFHASVHEALVDPDAALHLLQQVQMGALTIGQLHEARRRCAISCPRAVVAFAHFLRYKRSQRSKNEPTDTKRDAATSSRGAGKRCTLCGSTHPASASACCGCGQPLEDPPNRPSRHPLRSKDRDQIDEPTPDIVTRVDSHAMGPFPEVLPFPRRSDTPRPKRSGRGTK